MVFDYIQVTFETLYEWLGFLFDLVNLKDFKATADAFETLFQDLLDVLTVSNQGYWMSLSGPAQGIHKLNFGFYPPVGFHQHRRECDYAVVLRPARTEVGGYFDKLITYFGTQ